MKTTLEEYIVNNFTGKAVCVVGNAVITKKYGKIIDDHDIVMRINHYDLSDRFVAFTGRKTTHYCNEGLNWRSQNHSFTVSLCPFPERCEGTVITDGEPFDVDNWGGKKICPSKDWRKLAGIPRLTTGSTIVYILNELEISTNIFGFDFLKTGHMWEPEYDMQKHTAHIKEIDKEEALIKSLSNVTICS